MSDNISELCDALTEKSHAFTKKESIIKDYSFYYITNNIINKKIYSNIDQSKILIIDQYQEAKQNENLSYIILGFEKTIIIIKHFSLPLLQDLLSRNKKLSFCFLSDSKAIFNQAISKSYNEIENSKEFLEDISVFSKNINLFKFKNHILRSIKSCISGYLLKKSYLKLNMNRIEEFSHKKTLIPRTFDEDEFIELRKCGIGSSFAVTLFYHISKEELVVIKRPNTLTSEIQKLVQREIINYSKLKYPLIPKYYGTQNNDLVIEFLNGRTLSNIKNLNLTVNEKITIIFEIMVTIGFIHQNHFIYRDLKPNNIIIDENKTAVLIDFDRMIEYNDSFSEQIHTVDFSHVYSAPEITETNFSYECDIYSIGQMIYFIMNEKNPKTGNDLNSGDFRSFDDMKEMYINCTKREVNERPIISELILEFLTCYHLNIEIQNLYETFCDYFQKTYDDETIEVIKDILNDQDEKDPKMLYEIGYRLSVYAYSNGGDINIPIHYLTLSAEKNYPPAQNLLGKIYDCGYFFPRDSQKALHYFELAANNGDAESYFILGVLYMDGLVVKCDYSKAIDYFNRAAEKNYDQAFYYLGAHYLCHEKDFEKAKKYLSIAADHDIVESFRDLGLLYQEPKCQNYDIDKAIYYFTKGADKGNAESQYFLGEIYYKSRFKRQDIKKALALFMSSTYSNYDEAQYRLGKIYLKGKIVPYDKNRALFFLSLSANQNNSKAQYTLGKLYKWNKDNKKCIYYLKLAIENDNNPKALFALGSLYLCDTAMLDIDKLSPLAQSVIGELYFKGNHIHHDISLASDNNIAEAQINLGLIYMHSEFIKKDINKAIYYLKKASDNNNPTAQFLLGSIFSSTINDKYEFIKGIQLFRK